MYKRQVQDGAELTGVEVAPAALGLMIVEPAGSGALGTGPVGQECMREINVHFAGIRPEVHRGDAPGALNAQDTPVKLAIFHGYWMSGVEIRCTARGDSQGGRQPLLWGEPPACGGVGGTRPPRHRR